MSTGPAVLDGKIRYVSVSQIERFDAEGFGGCQRKWWFRYVGGLKETQGKAAKLGEQVHAQFEHYLKTGDDVLGELARAAKRFIPKPGSGIAVETPIGRLREHLPGGIHGAVDSDLTCAGVSVIGRLDVVDERDEHVVESGDDTETISEPGVVEVLDWKTTRQIDDVLDADGNVDSRGYSKTTDQMANTHQMVGYAELVRRTRPSATAVRVSHVYVQTAGPRKAAKRSTILQFDQIVRRFSKSETVVEEMKGVARLKDVKDVTANYKACGAYGGCQFRGACPRDPKAVMAEVFGGLSAANLTKRLRRTDNRPTGGAMNLLERVNAKKNPAADPAVEAAKVDLAAEEKALKSGVTPPDMPAASAIADPPEVGDVGQEAGCPVGGTSREMDIDAVATKKFACVCGVALKVKPQKLGDGKFYALVPKHGEVETKVETPAETTSQGGGGGGGGTILSIGAERIGEKAAAPLLEKRIGLTLFLDCAPDSMAVQHLDGYVARLADALSQEHARGVDIRCAPGDGPLAFGKWKGALATLCRAEPPAAGSYAVSSSSELAMVVFEALAPTATFVVRGHR